MFNEANDMSHVVLSEQEQDTIRRCIVAILDGPFIDDREFQTRLGVDRHELRTILSAWHPLETTSEEANQMAINNCINEIAHGVRIPPAEWDKWFKVPKQEVQGTYRKWCALNGLRSGIR